MTQEARYTRFMRAPICQSRLPFAPWMDALTNRLPGLQPVADGDWLQRDDAFAAQMAYRDELAATRCGDIFAMRPEAEPPAAELLARILYALAQDPAYRVEPGRVLRPDRAAVSLDQPPLLAAGRLVQEDLLILTRDPGRPDAPHILTGAFLAFPASWTLAQKIGRPLADIHIPVARYDAVMAARVEKVLRLLQPGQSVWRANYLRYNDPDLHQPRLEGEHRPFDPAGPCWVRVERQTLTRLPETGAIVFTIHTFLAPWETLSADEAAGLIAMAGAARG